MAGSKGDIERRRCAVVAAYFDESVPLDERSARAVAKTLGVSPGVVVKDIRASGLEPRSYRSPRGWQVWNKGDLVSFSCEICGMEFGRWPAQAKRKGRAPRYCSRECSHEAKRRVTGREHPLYTKVDVSCLWCGKTFTVKAVYAADEGRGRYCSRECVGSATSAAQGGRSSGIEHTMADAFDAIGIPYERQAKIGRWSVDFLLPSAVVVECDGDYWHGRPEVVARDIRKNADLREQGYIVIRLNESEIRASPEALAQDVARQYQEATATASGVDESGKGTVPVAA